MKIVTCAQMKEMEHTAIGGGISALRLMENAGSAAARRIREAVVVEGKKCLVLCGRGNNGGDGFVVARKLIESGARVTVILACGMPMSAEAQEMFERLSTLRPAVLSSTQFANCSAVIRESDYIIDAIYGTGFHGSVTDELVGALIESANAGGAPVFALDMPSGANADSGEVAGVCIHADMTVTFAAPKTGQFLFPAANFCGTVHTVAIGLPDSAYNIGGDQVELLDASMVESALPPREKNSNKGSYGKALCVCGSLGMAGAAGLSAFGALRCGAGLVTLCVPESIYVPVASKLLECMVYPAAQTPGGALSQDALPKIRELAHGATALLVGCGLSKDEEARRAVRTLVTQADFGCPIILDADGINAFEGHIDLLRTSKAELILTPHPGEMARLCGKTAAQVQDSRLETARSFALENSVTLVLKGANTIVAAKDGRAFVNPTGNPGMAKGGSGDILAGMITALVAQGIAPISAACCGVFVHGLAGDRTAQKLSQYGMIPSDLLAEVPQIFREMSR